MIVVDTSVLVDFFRGKPTVQVRNLRRLEREEIPYAIPAVCCQEVLQGAVDEEEWARLHSYFVGQEILVPAEPWSVHTSAARIYFDCRRRGITIGSAVDCLVAQLVLEDDNVLLHSDEDFERMKQVRPLRTLFDEPVLPSS